MINNSEKIQFKPNVFATPTLIILVFVLIIFSIFGFTILPKAYNLYQQFPEQEPLQILLISLIGTILPPVFFTLAIFLNTRCKKITIDGKLLFFQEKSFLKPINSKIFNLENVEMIGYRKQATPIFTGKTVVVITHYWFIFFHKDGHKEETSLDGWDINTLKNLIFYLRGKYPKLKWNTHLYRDPPEKLSGIDEYLNQVKKTS